MAERRKTPRPGRDRRQKKTFARGAMDAVVRDPNQHAVIARRAFEIYEQRGGGHGHDWDDWLQAEREVLAALGTSTEGTSSHDPPDHAEITQDKAQAKAVVGERKEE